MRNNLSVSSFLRGAVRAGAADREKERMASERAAQEGRAVVMFAIDPLLAALAHFDTSEDLTERIHLLFRVLDVDENNALSFDELSVGLKKLRVRPEIRLSLHDWDVMTHAVPLTEGQELCLAEFELVMRRQLKLYVQRQLANAMEVVGNDSPDRPGTTFFVLKLLLIGVDEILLNTTPVRTSAAHQSSSKPTRPASAGCEGGDKAADLPLLRGHPVLGTTRTSSNAECSTSQRLEVLESKMDDLQESMRYLVKCQRDADDKAAAAFHLTDPAAFFSHRLHQAQGITSRIAAVSAVPPSAVAPQAPSALQALDSQLDACPLPPSPLSHPRSKHELPHFQVSLCCVCVCVCVYVCLFE